MFTTVTAPKSPSQLPIIIIGAGLGGLLLAQGLKKAHIPFHIYERDPAAIYRPQGYRIRLHDAALKAVLPETLFAKFKRSCSVGKPGFNAVNPFTGESVARPEAFGGKGSLLPHVPRASAGPGGPGGTGGTGGRASGGPPINVCGADRTTMRRVLADGLLDNTDIFYGKQFSSYKLQPEGGVVAEFSDGTTALGRLLVGADGIRSGVREQFLPSHKLLDFEGRAIYGKTTITPELRKRFTGDAMEVMTLMSDKRPDSPSLILFLEAMTFDAEARKDGLALPDNYVYWVLMSHKSVLPPLPMTSSEFMRLSPAEAAKLSVEMTKGWAENVKVLLELQDVEQTSTIRGTSAGPEIPFWEPEEMGRVTLLGDAVHPMSPTGGMGAGHALMDAMELVKIISEKGEEGITAVDLGKYESAMRERSSPAVLGSSVAGVKMYGAKPLAECKPVEW